MKRAWILAVSTLGLAIVVLIAFFTFFQERLLFYPTRSTDAAPSSPRPSEEIILTVPFHGEPQKIHSLYFPVKGAESLILYFHGNAGSLQEWAFVASEIAERTGASVWIMDYPGYGKSEGFIQNETQLQDIASAFFLAIPERGDFRNLILYGRSLGSGLAAYLAGQYPDRISGVILETPFQSLTQLVHDYAPWFPQALLRYRFESEKSLLRYNGPILIFHGEKDEVIPVQHADRLAESLASRGSVSYVEIPNGHHNDLFQFPEYRDSLVNWIKDLEFNERQDEE